MFTGIVEATGVIVKVLESGSNKSFWIESTLSSSFKPDQSIAHNGVCLTIEEVAGLQHRVTAIDETLKKTNLGTWKAGDLVNLEQSLLAQSRIDGHFVQGHVDTTGTCISVKNSDGSYEYEIKFPKKFTNLIIEKGSICLNGISLTAFNVKKSTFKVAVIPYTYDHTNIRFLEKGMTVNLEFDLLGKYILRKVLTGSK